MRKVTDLPPRAWGENFLTPPPMTPAAAFAFTGALSARHAMSAPASLKLIVRDRIVGVLPFVSSAASCGALPALFGGYACSIERPRRLLEIESAVWTAVR